MERPEARPRREAPKAPVNIAPPNQKAADLVRELFQQLQLEPAPMVDEVALTVPAERLVEVCQTCKQDSRLALDYLRCLSVVEYGEHFQAVYHLYSTQHRHKLALKVNAPKGQPVFPSVASVWRGADWHEREGAELFGVTFSGHPEPKPLLLFEEFQGKYPLRKDYPFEEVEEWQGERW